MAVLSVVIDAESKSVSGEVLLVTYSHGEEISAVSTISVSTLCSDL